MFPIILAHGIARFDILRQKVARELQIPPNPLDDRLQYFRNIRTFLNANGFPQVLNTDVEFAGSVAERSEQLKTEVNDFLHATGAEKVHIIAHSMGGLDARRMIVNLEMAEKVASLTTIGTPHRGTILADKLLDNNGIFLLDTLEKIFNLSLDGFRDLTVETCEAFNQDAEDAEARNSVVYQTYASSEDFSRMFLPLIPSWAIINLHGESNDGLVPFKSQQWKNELIATDGTRKQIRQNIFPFQADHLNQVGWWDSNEMVLFAGSRSGQRREFETKIKNIYLGIARNLRNL